MKKLIFLLFPFFMLAQNPTNFPYGIKNTVAPSNSTPSYFVTQEVDGVHKKTPAAIFAKNADLTTKQELIDLTTVSGWGDSLTSGTGSTLEIYSYLGYFSSLTGYSVYNGGVGGETSTQIKDRMIANTSRYGNSVIIWAGRNNYNSPITVKADIATMVAALGHTRYLVVGIINGDYGAVEYIGGAGLTVINNLNSDLATIYGSHFVDIRPYLVSQYNPLIPQDVIDFANDVPPSSLRFDQLHLNNLGYQKVAEKIKLSLSILEGNSKITDARYLSNLIANPPFIGAVTKNRGGFTYLDIVNDINVTGDSFFNRGYFSNTLFANKTTANFSALTIGGGNVSGWQFINSNSSTSNILKGFVGSIEKINLYPAGTSFFNGGNVAIGTTTTGGAVLKVVGQTVVDGGLNAIDITTSALPFLIGGAGNSNGGWTFQNQGNPTSRVVLRGYNGTALNISLNPSSTSFFKVGNLLMGTDVDDGVNRLQVTGTASSGTTTLNNTPPTANNHLTRKDYVDLKAPLASPTFTGTPTAPTPTAGDNDTSIATTAFVTGEIATAVVTARPYKVYTVVMNQTATSAPTIVITFENTLGGSIVWTRNGVGDYRGTLTGAFTSLKTVAFTSLAGAVSTTPLFINGERISNNEIRITTYNGTNPTDGLMTNAIIEFRVYN